MKVFPSFTVLTCFTILLTSLSILFPVNEYVFADEIPSWVKDTANFWYKGEISDQEFVNAISFLIENNIIKISNSKMTELWIENENLKENTQKINDEKNKIQYRYDNLVEEFNQMGRSFNELQNNNKNIPIVDSSSNEITFGNSNNDYFSLLEDYNNLKQMYEQLSNDYDAAIFGFKELDDRNSYLENNENNYEQQLKQEERNRLEVLSKTHPVLKGIINGGINYYIEPLPYYASDETQEYLAQFTEHLDSKSLFYWVDDPDDADLVIGWVKDYGSHRLGESIFKSYIKVGLGQTNCHGDWMSFDGSTVYKILIHELGHSLGFGHSTDENNVMYYETSTSFEKELEKTITLDESQWTTVLFCGHGNYWYKATSLSDSNGFYAFVLPPETSPSTFLSSGGTHYTGCGSEDLDISARQISDSCNVKFGSKLMLYNKDDLLQTNAIQVEITIIPQNPTKWPDLNYKSEDLEYSAEFLNYVAQVFD